MKKLLLLALLPFSAFASGYQPIVINTYVGVDVEVIEQAKTALKQSQALGIAFSQLQFNHSTNSLQWSVGAGSFEGESAIAVGFGKRLTDEGLMLNLSIGGDNDHKGYGAGLSGKF